MCKDLKSKRHKEWVNLGGQMMQKDDVDKLRSDIGSGKLKTWKDIHNRYDDLWVKYKVDKQKHAFATLCELYEVKTSQKLIGSLPWIKQLISRNLLVIRFTVRVKKILIILSGRLLSEIWLK